MAPLPSDPPVRAGHLATHALRRWVPADRGVPGDHRALRRRLRRPRGEPIGPGDRRDARSLGEMSGFPDIGSLRRDFWICGLPRGLLAASGFAAADMVRVDQPSPAARENAQFRWGQSVIDLDFESAPESQLIQLVEDLHRFEFRALENHCWGLLSEFE